MQLSIQINQLKATNCKANNKLLHHNSSFTFSSLKFCSLLLVTEDRTLAVCVNIRNIISILCYYPTD